MKDWSSLSEIEQDNYIRDAVFHLYANPHKSVPLCELDIVSYGGSSLPLNVIEHAKNNYEKGVVLE